MICLSLVGFIVFLKYGLTSFLINLSIIVLRVTDTLNRYRHFVPNSVAVWE